MPATNKGERVRGPDWDARRKQGIGGSEAAIVLGISPWKTALALYMEKRGEAEPENIGGQEYVYWGNRLENTVAQEYAMRFNVKVRRHNLTMQSKRYSFMFCNLDRSVSRNATMTKKIILECKTIGHFAFNPNQWGDDGTQFVPPQYYAQAQHNIEVANADQCDMPVLIAGNQFRTYRIPRDEAFISRIVEAEGKFMDAVKNGVPPEPVNLADLLLMFPTHEPGTKIEAPPELVNAWRALSIIKGRIREAKIDGVVFEMALKRFMGENEVLTFNGEPLATWRTSKNGRRTFKIKEPSAQKCDGDEGEE